MEVQSLAVMEALASGTPVLGLSNETIDQLVDSRVGARLEKDTAPEQFAREVRALCEADADAYARMCRAARERVQPFDWSNTIDLTLDMYRRTSRGRGRTRRGTAVIPLLLAVAQIFLAIVMYGIFQIRRLFEGLE
jgi:glycosyltransferase involved in cell wall biosynthesis